MLGFDKQFGHESNGVPKVITPLLRQDCTTGHFGSVAFEVEQAGDVGLDQDRELSKASFKGLKGGISDGGPRPGGTLLGKVIEGTCKAGEVANETAVETHKT